MPILCCIDEPLKRPYYYSQILHKLHTLTMNNELAVSTILPTAFNFRQLLWSKKKIVQQVVITNELVTQVDKDGKSFYTAAGGQYVNDYAFAKLELTRLTNNKFATRLAKSPMMPEISVTFMVIIQWNHPLNFFLTNK